MVVQSHLVTETRTTLHRHSRVVYFWIEKNHGTINDRKKNPVAHGATTEKNYLTISVLLASF